MTSYLIFWLGMAWGMGRVAQKTQQNTQNTPNTDLGGRVKLFVQGNL